MGNTLQWKKRSVIWVDFQLSAIFISLYIYPCNGQWRPLVLCDVEVPTFSRQSAPSVSRKCRSLDASQPYRPSQTVTWFRIYIYIYIYMVYLMPLLLTQTVQCRVVGWQWKWTGKHVEANDSFPILSTIPIFAFRNRGNTSVGRVPTESHSRDISNTSQKRRRADLLGLQAF
jgi:hypothetical protein